MRERERERERMREREREAERYVPLAPCSPVSARASPPQASSEEARGRTRLCKEFQAHVFYQKR